MTETSNQGTIVLNSIVSPRNETISDSPRYETISDSPRYETISDSPRNETVGDAPTKRASPKQTKKSEEVDISHGTGGEDKTPAAESRPGCCRRCCAPFILCCGKFTHPCLRTSHPMSTEPARGERFKDAFLCPPHGKLARYVTLATMAVLMWATVWSIVGKDALPGGNFFGLVVLVAACLLGGAIVELIRLPALLGMLIVGLALRNVPYINVAKDIDSMWASSLRNIALVVILTRAGLGLDPVALRKLSMVVIRLAFLPCIFESITVAIAAHLFLGFPWTYGFMLGFVLAAVSPAVVVPSLLSLQERGFGLDKGVPTLVIAAASIDDVLAISGFGVVLGITFSQGNIVLTIFRGPLEALAGVVYGLLMGVFLWYFPNPDKKEHRTLYRFILLFTGGLFAAFGSRMAEIPGAGALGVLTMAFVAGLRWRKEMPDNEDDPVSEVFGTSWIIFQPLLFGLIGAEIDVLTIQPATIGLGLAVLGVGLVIRSLVAFLAVFGAGLNLKEKFFIPLAWLPKATVQAAIGSVALDTAKAKNLGADKINLGVQVLTIAVLVILVTAPVGAALVAITGPRFLHRSQGNKKESDPPSNGPSVQAKDAAENAGARKTDTSDDELAVEQNLV